MFKKNKKKIFRFEKKIPDDLKVFFNDEKNITKKIFSKTNLEANAKFKKADEVLEKIFSDVRGQKILSSNINYLSSFSKDLIDKNLNFMDR